MSENTTNLGHKIANGGQSTLEWIWRIATLVIVPLLIWVALTLRDVDQRMGVVEANRPTRVEVIQYNNELREQILLEIRLLRQELNERGRP